MLACIIQTHFLGWFSNSFFVFFLIIFWYLHKIEITYEECGSVKRHGIRKNMQMLIFVDNKYGHQLVKKL